MKLKKLLAVLLSLCIFACAAAYAAANTLGDVDGDGQISAADARLCLRQAVGLETYANGSAEFTACDATGDGNVTAEDARLILRAAVGLEDLGGEQGMQPDYTANNEYDILRGDTFYFSGTMTDSAGVYPVETAMAPNLIYMRTNMDGMPMAIQVLDGDVYMIAPEKNKYHKLTKAEMSMLELNVNDITGNAGFSDLPPLSAADTVIDGMMDGTTSCKVYTFIGSNGRRQVYMQGDKLLGMDMFNNNWIRTEAIRFTAVSRTLPDNVKKAGGGTRSVGLLAFMALFM